MIFKNLVLQALGIIRFRFSAKKFITKISCWCAFKLLPRSNAVSIITASQLHAVSFTVAGQLLLQLLLLVNFCLSYYFKSTLVYKLLQVNLLPMVNLCISYCSRSHSCVRVTSTGLVLCQLFLRINPCFYCLSMIKHYPDFCCM
jgi:hypothetical protein